MLVRADDGAIRTRSYQSDLWAAAYIIQGGCSDDCFAYFRGWLIAQGEAVFSAALRNPEPLVDVASIDPADNECEALLSVAWTAYQAKTGQNLPPPLVVQPDLSHVAFDEEPVHSPFPKLRLHKPKKLALTACMHKRLTILNARVKRPACWVMPAGLVA